MSLCAVSPVGSSRMPLDRNDPSFSTPTTPIPRSLSKSTPRALTVKPPPVRSRVRNQTEDDISVQPLSQPDDQIVDTSDDPFLIPVSEPRNETQCPQSYLEMLPPEILEGIVGHVVGHLGSTMSDPSGSQHSVRNWNAIMRHPRRKKVADLALVSCTWRRLIQERVYRHSKMPLIRPSTLDMLTRLQSKYKEQELLFKNADIGSSKTIISKDMFDISKF